MFLLPPLTSQMDPKLRPSFPDIAKRLEEIQKKLKDDDSERERMLLTAGEVEKKPLPKGVCLFTHIHKHIYFTPSIDLSNLQTVNMIMKTTGVRGIIFHLLFLALNQKL